MPHPGLGTRTSRTRALEIGTDPAGFDEKMDYDPQAGHPILPGLPGGHYVEQPPQISPSGPAPINQPNPIK
jgi:hypothetical protein